jgi:hypothetical protein
LGDTLGYFFHGTKCVHINFDKKIVLATFLRLFTQTHPVTLKHFRWRDPPKFTQIGIFGWFLNMLSGNPGQLLAGFNVMNWEGILCSLETKVFFQRLIEKKA